MDNKYLSKTLNNYLSKALNNQHLIKNLGIILLSLIFLTILFIFIYSLRNLYLKKQLKNINNVNHLSFKRRNLKNSETFKFKFDKDLMKQFKSFCKRKKITESSFLENLITENLSKGDGFNVSKNNLKLEREFYV